MCHAEIFCHILCYIEQCETVYGYSFEVRLKTAMWCHSEIFCHMKGWEIADFALKYIG